MGIMLSAPVRALLIGAATGLRTSVPLALVNVQARRKRLSLGEDTFATVTRRLGMLGDGGLVVGSSVVGAVGEVLVDKAPGTPSRLEPLSLLGRVVMGGVLGAVVQRDAGRPWLPGTVLGALGAAAGAFAGAKARETAARRTPLPDPAVAVGEDATCVGMAALAVGNGRGG